MARRKRTITQRDFGVMEVREDLLERDDTELRQRSLRDASNLRSLASGAFEGRWGSLLMTQFEDARQIVEIKPADGEVYALLLIDDALRVLNENGTTKQNIASVPWSDASGLYVEPFRDKTIIGGTFGIRVLNYNGSTFSLDAFEFDEGPGGELAQPYWSFRPGSRIQPAGYTGTVAITYYPPGSSTPGNLPSEIAAGTKIRYHFREMEVVNSAQVTITDRIPPSYDITVTSGTNFQSGQVVIGASTGWEGYVTEIATNVLKCVTIKGFEGPDVGEDLSGPSGSSEVTAKSAIVASPYRSPLWDEALINSYKGYPRAATTVSGRLAFLDFPGAPDVITVSSARAITDFSVGAADDDAIARAIGDNSPRLLHAVNAGDLVILSDRGCYYVPTRDNGILTPSTFNPVLFDRRGSSSIRPALVEDGVVFLDASGKKLAAALLDGNIYLKWTVKDLSILAPHLIKSPVMLCPPVIDDDAPEKYVLIVNEDGTITAASWQDTLGPESVGFCEWSTDGDYIAAGPAFGSYWSIVDRNGTRCIERFDENTYLDGADVYASGSIDVSHLSELWYYIDGNFLGPYEISGGTPVGAPSPQVGWQFGQHFNSEATFWPNEVIDNGQNGTDEAKVLRFGVKVQYSRGFQIVSNRSTRTIGTYAFGDDLSEAPPARTQTYIVPVFGMEEDPTLKVVKHEPGPWRILKAIQEVKHG